ncbi:MULTISPECIES: ParA family protein [unclassified Haloferax]|jgi:chromosome partitioning protein|uniref:ParA family protein n=1 Tax=unclassified Haloferax TaxID=2625095 RepID=UPI00287630B6|nr:MULTISPECIES: ParA family protein [unclassified Haloferax]MDS0243129.1 ParA family protein [Haloferax sp. S2CR25]MDS0446250.1 ParA family protein [Haloferax sp. S2CR25-2]
MGKHGDSMKAQTSQNGVVAVCILKGGMGKSTIAINLTDRLQENHGDTVYIDIDKNGHGTEFLGFGDAYKNNGDLEDVIFRDKHPSELVIETEFGFGVIASSSEMSTINDRMKNQMNADVILKKEVIEPLREDGYDYVVLDAPGDPSKVADNALVAAQSFILPVIPGQGSVSGLERIMETQILPIIDATDGAADILAITPNMLSESIRPHKPDRRLLEDLNKNWSDYVPAYARITEEQWEQIDSKGRGDIPLPGIRERDALSDSFDENMPVAHFDPSCDQIEHFDTLAEIVAERA